MPTLTMPTVRRSVTVPCEHGVHLRVAAKIVERARPFQSRVWLSGPAVTADAKSILGLLNLGAVKGTTLVITAHGPDAETAAHAIAEFFTDHADPCGSPSARPA